MKRKFKVYPSAYANMYASAVCSGKITPGGKKEKEKEKIMSKGLRSWVQANWVDIANPKKGGGFPKCGRSKGEKRRNYPKCVPAAKARAMTPAQRRAAVSRKKKAESRGRSGKNLTTLEHNYLTRQILYSTLLSEDGIVLVTLHPFP